MNQFKHEDFFSTLESLGVNINQDHKNKIECRINDVVSYEPKIGIFGKTGAGKSSLCNALFGQDICEISDVKACTRDPQEVLVSIGKKGIKLIDVPGVGESGDRDKEYAQLYGNLLPKLDAILWVLKGDDRAFSSDEVFYKNIVRPYIRDGVPFFMVINQVDKIEPFREWNEESREPGARQSKNIKEKRHSVAGFFELPLNKVIPVSANEKYNLIELMDSIIFSLPREKRISTLKAAPKENISQEAKNNAETGFLEEIVGFILKNVITSIPGPIGTIVSKIPGVGTALEKAGNFIVSGLKSVASRIGSFFGF